MATTSKTYLEGGLSERYKVSRIDGVKIPENKRYFVLNYNGEDPHAIKAMEAYAQSVSAENPQLASDIMTAIKNPEAAPKQH